MKVSIFIFVLLLAFSSRSQIVPSSCTASDSIVNIYKSDAYRLAVRRTYKINSTFEDSVRIDPLLKNMYLQALLAVYNATSLPARDTLVFLNLHTLSGTPDMNTFLIAGDSTTNWMHDLRNNIFPTSNATLNNLLIKYSLIKTSYTALATQAYHLVSFQTDSCWNISALVNEFSVVSGVINSGPNQFSWDGSDITDSINPNYIELNYTLAWGDCMLGCTSHRTWKFRIFPDCSVSYISSTGQSILGFFSGVPIFNPGGDNLTIFPNPAENILNIKIESPNYKNARFKIFSTSGQVLKDEVFSEKIDISNLENGIYFLSVYFSGRQRTFKIVKN